MTKLIALLSLFSVTALAQPSIGISGAGNASQIAKENAQRTWVAQSATPHAYAGAYTKDNLKLPQGSSGPITGGATTNAKYAGDPQIQMMMEIARRRAADPRFSHGGIQRNGGQVNRK